MVDSTERHSELVACFAAERAWLDMAKMMWAAYGRHASLTVARGVERLEPISFDATCELARELPLWGFCLDLLFRQPPMR